MFPGMVGKWGNEKLSVTHNVLSSNRVMDYKTTSIAY